MKAAIAFALFVAGVCAVPRMPALPRSTTQEITDALKSGQERLVTGSIESAINDLAQSIADAGLDPVNVEHQSVDFVTAVPSIFSIKGNLDNLHFSGASNIVTNRLSFNAITFRLNLDIELPELLFTLDDSNLDLNVLDYNFNSHFSGSLAVRRLQITGNIRVSVGIISGVSIRSMAMTLNLGSIDSGLNVSIQGEDISSRVNSILGEQIPASLARNSNDINEYITLVLRNIVEDAL